MASPSSDPLLRNRWEPAKAERLSVRCGGCGRGIVTCMALVDEYLAQERWRPWDRMLACVPVLKTDTVLDLGCGPGAVAARLAARARLVVGLDRDPALLAAARRRSPANCRFVEGDMRRLAPIGVRSAGGIWSSFTAAYYPAFERILEVWLPFLKPGGWIALVEVDRMLRGHRPLPEDVRGALERFEDFMRRSQRYDFSMGSKLVAICEKAGLDVRHHSTWEDAELAFQGPARPEVAEAWRRRFERMPALEDYLGDRIIAIREQFLACLASPLHRSEATIVLAVARKPRGSG